MYRQVPFTDKLPYTYNPSNVNVAEDKQNLFKPLYY